MPQALADKLGACGFFETSAKTRTNVDELFKAAVRAKRESVPGYVDVFGLASELARLVMLAQRFDGRSAFHRLPRDVVALIGRRVIDDARDYTQRVHWQHAIEVRREKNRRAKDGKAAKKCALQ